EYKFTLYDRLEFNLGFPKWKSGKIWPGPKESSTIPKGPGHHNLLFSVTLELGDHQDLIGVDHIRVLQDVCVGIEYLLVLHGVAIILFGYLAEGFPTLYRVPVVDGFIRHGDVGLDVGGIFAPDFLDLVPKDVLFIRGGRLSLDFKDATFLNNILVLYVQFQAQVQDRLILCFCAHDFYS